MEQIDFISTTFSSRSSYADGGRVGGSHSSGDKQKLKTEILAFFELWLKKWWVTELSTC
jgi:hypothetical protein